MDARPFLARLETFGFEGGSSWAMDALRLLFHTPRLYLPLAQAWDVRHPGTLRALRRLTQLGLVAWQGPVVIDTRTGQPAASASRRVPRYRTTASGARLVKAVGEDLRVLDDLYPRTAAGNKDGVVTLLRAFDLDNSHARFGMSSAHVARLCGMSPRTVKWWVARLRRDGHLRELPTMVADVRAVVPGHWRVTRALATQLQQVIGAYDSAPESLVVDFRLGRKRYLGDIDPARIGISGATDYDHDVQCQEILAGMISSPRAVTAGRFSIEPRLRVPIDDTVAPWQFRVGGGSGLSYQPDAEMLVREDGTLWRNVIEYERYQTRRDAWNHIERFLGYLATSTLPSEAATLRFVLDSSARAQSYGELLAAFGDYAGRHPERMPGNRVVLAAASALTLEAAKDPLDLRYYHRLELARADTAGVPVLHPADDSPYEEYFSRR